MNIVVIPSWYPSVDHPFAGIFFREQAKMLAKCAPESTVAISTWGSHMEQLWIDKQSGLRSIAKLLSKKPAAFEKPLLSNCIEYFTPAFTWTIRLLHGNIGNIIAANYANIRRFEATHGKVDILHAHVAYPAGFVAMKLAKRLNIPYVVTEHMSPFPFASFMQKGRVSPLVSRPLQQASKVISVNQLLGQSIQRKVGVKSLCVHNMVDEHRFRLAQNPKSVTATSACYDTNATVKKALFVGRLEEQKGVVYLLKALGQMDASLSLTIVGEGEQTASLKQLAQLLKLHERHTVHWEGWKSQEELVTYYQSHDFLVLPSLHENNPLVLLEALACGLPIVATHCNGSEEVVDASVGVLAEVGNAADLSEKIGWMQTNLHTFDPFMIRRVFDQRYASHVIAKKIFATYQEVL